MGLHKSYDDPLPALRRQEAMADLWEQENLEGQIDSVSRRLALLATDICRSMASDDVVEVIAQLEKLIKELDQIKERLP